MKQPIILILTLLLSIFANAQSNIRPWQHGPLTWNDFKTVPRSIAEEHSYLEFLLTVDQQPEHYDRLHIYTNNAHAYIDRDKSWVDTAYRTPAQLRYNQVIFNLAELYRRHLQTEIDTGGNPNLDYYMKLLTADVDTFSLQSNYGNDTVTVTLWDNHIRRQLDDITPLMTEKHTQHIAYTASLRNYDIDHRFGFGIGAAFKTPLGNLHHYFRPGGAFYMDCEFGTNRNLFNFGFLIGGSRCLDTVWHKTDPDQDLWTGDRLTVLDLKFDYGYALIDNHSHRLQPFIGIGMLGYYYNETYGEETTSLGPTSLSWRLGIDYRYHFTSDLITFRRRAEATQFSLFAKIYAESAHFSRVIGEPRGITLNLAVGLSFQEIGGRYKRPATSPAQ